VVAAEALLSELHYNSTFALQSKKTHPALKESWNSLGWKGPLNISSFQPPGHGQGHLPLDQAAQSPTQPGLEHFQGEVIALSPSFVGYQFNLMLLNINYMPAAVWILRPFKAYR